ncbi:YncE family protein, partial [Nonomuraea sp. NPDC050153]|uniref:YncE family protein n=1 Tax=Nonomuraea sp. NPDC050153 TaxID=3364359 RepID=UPI0037B53F4B
MRTKQKADRTFEQQMERAEPALAVTNTIALDTGAQPESVAVSPDGRFVYVTENQFGNLVVIRNGSASQPVVEKIPVGRGPVGLAVHPQGSIYVANSLAGTVSVIQRNASTDTHGARATITLGGAQNNGPWGVVTPGPRGFSFLRPVIRRDAVLPRAARDIPVCAYVTDALDGSLTAITPSDLALGPIPLTPGFVPHGIAITPAGGRLYVTDARAPGAVAVFDWSTDPLVRTISVGSSPENVVAPRDFVRGSGFFDFFRWLFYNNVLSVFDGVGFAYAADTGGNTVSVIKRSTNNVVETITLGGPSSGPYGIAAFKGRIYVTSAFAGTVSVIERRSNGSHAFREKLDLGGSAVPHGIAVTPAGNRLYEPADKGFGRYGRVGAISAVLPVCHTCGQERAP